MRRLCESPTGRLQIGKTEFALPGYQAPISEVVCYSKTFMDKIVKATIRSAYENTASSQTMNDLRLLAAEALEDEADVVLVDIRSNTFWKRVLDDLSVRLVTDATNIIQEHLFTHLFEHARYETTEHLSVSPLLLLTVRRHGCRYAAIEPMFDSGTPTPEAVQSKRDEAPAAKACRLATALVHLVTRSWTLANTTPTDVRCCVPGCCSSCQSGFSG